MKNSSISFKQHLFLEGRIYLGQKVGDILSALQNLRDDASNIGKRHLIRLIKQAVGQIRQVLHGQWTFEEEKYLKELQKVGVALMRALDTGQEDLPSIIASATAELEKLVDQIDVPIHNLGSPVYSKQE